MSLNVKDANNVTKTLKTTLDGSDHVPHHIVDSLPSVTVASLPDVVVSSSAPVALNVNNATADAFSRLRISSPTVVYECIPRYNGSDVDYRLYTANGGDTEHLENECAMALTTDTTDQAIAIRQSANYVRYQAGRSLMLFQTFVFGAAVTGNTQRVGFFDDDNGIFLQYKDGALSLVRRTFTSGAAVDNPVAQASWNIDPMTDGSGPSGVTLDPELAQIFVIDLQWLGVGRVRAGFDIGGELHYVHEFKHANVLSTVYMQTATLPLRYENYNHSATVSGTVFKTFCSAALSEGGDADPGGDPHAISTGGTLITVVSARPLISLRPKLTYSGLRNNTAITLETISVMATTANVLISIYRNRTLTTPSWTSVGTNSGMEYDVTAAAATADGDLIRQFYVTGDTKLPTGSIVGGTNPRLPFSLNVAGDTADTLTVWAAPVAGGSPEVGVAINWRELH